MQNQTQEESIVFNPTPPVAEPTASTPIPALPTLPPLPALPDTSPTTPSRTPAAPGETADTPGTPDTPGAKSEAFAEPQDDGDAATVDLGNTSPPAPRAAALALHEPERAPQAGPESILKRRSEDAALTSQAPYASVLPSARVASEREHGRPKERRVKLQLPEGHVDKERNSRSRRARPSRSGLGLAELHERYITVCGAFKISPSVPVLEAFATQKATGSEVAPAMFTLDGVARCHIEEVMALCEVIVLNANLRCLDVSNSGLRDDHVEKICNALIFRRTVDRLNLADNPRFGIDGVRFLALMLQRCLLLTYLNVSGIHMSQKMAAHFGHAVGKSKLRTLIMHRAALKDSVALASVTRGCGECGSLSSLSFKSNEISTSAASDSIATLMGRVTNIACFDLRCNRLRDEGLMRIAPALANIDSNLTKLVMYDNQIGDAGAIAVFMALRKNESLKSIDFSANKIGTPVVMTAFKEMLMINTTLESVFFWKTGLHDEGLVALAEGLAENKSIKRLELRNNSITVAGLMALVHAVKVSPSVFKVMVEVPESDGETGGEDLVLELYQMLQRECALNLEQAHSREAAEQEAELGMELGLGNLAAFGAMGVDAGVGAGAESGGGLDLKKVADSHRGDETAVAPAIAAVATALGEATAPSAAGAPIDSIASVRVQGDVAPAAAAAAATAAAAAAAARSAPTAEEMERASQHAINSGEAPDEVPQLTGIAAAAAAAGGDVDETPPPIIPIYPHSSAGGRDD